jgi:hypothetical protein
MVHVAAAWSDVKEKKAFALWLVCQWREGRDTSQIVEKLPERNLITWWKQIKK